MPAGQTFTLVLDHTKERVQVDLGAVSGTDLLSGRKMKGKAALPGPGAWIIRGS